MSALAVPSLTAWTIPRARIVGGAVSLNHTNWGVPQREITRLLSREGPEQLMAQTSALSQNPFPFLGLNVDIVTVIAVSPLPSSERWKSYFHFGYLMNYSVKLVFLVGCCFVCLFVCLVGGVTTQLMCPYIFQQ